MILSRGALPLVILSIFALALSGCSGMRSSQRVAVASPEQLTPIGNSTVASSALPPIGTDGSMQVIGTSPGQMQP